VIIQAGLGANIHLIPSSQNPPPVYDQIFKYVARLGIFFLLLDIKLKNLKYTEFPINSPQREKFIDKIVRVRKPGKTGRRRSVLP